MSPIRALLTAHVQTSWNHSVRELGRLGSRVFGMVVATLGLLATGPLFLGMGTLGWLLGSRLDHPLAPGLMGGVLALLSLGGGIFGGIVGGARQLNWESYRGFPLTSRNLYLAELLAGLGDPLPAILCVAVTGFLAGVALGSPASIPLLPLVLGETLFTLLALQLLVGGLAAALVKRLRLALALLAVLAWMGSTLFTTPLRSPAHKRTAVALPGDQRATVEAAAMRGIQLLSVLPTHRAALGLLRARQGQWGPALGSQGYPLALLALLMGLGVRLLARESRAGSSHQQPGVPDRLWTFRHPAEGVARLHFRTLMASQLGRLALLMPLMIPVLLKGPLSQLRGQELWVVPAAFAYLSLVGNNFVLNQFGLDRHGIKALLLLPLSARDLLLGKLVGMAAHQGIQVLLMGLLLATVGAARPAALLAGSFMLAAIFLAQCTLGQWTSVWSPRPMSMDSFQNHGMSFAVGMLSLATSGLWTSLFGGIYVLAAWLAPGWLVPVMALTFGLALAAHLALLPVLAKYLDARREVLVERLG